MGPEESDCQGSCLILGARGACSDANQSRLIEDSLPRNQLVSVNRQGKDGREDAVFSVTDVLAIVAGLAR
jgi:hypothetical protein